MAAAGDRQGGQAATPFLPEATKLPHQLQERAEKLPLSLSTPISPFGRGASNAIGARQPARTRPDLPTPEVRLKQACSGRRVRKLRAFRSGCRRAQLANWRGWDCSDPAAGDLTGELHLDAPPCGPIKTGARTASTAHACLPRPPMDFDAMCA